MKVMFLDESGNHDLTLARINPDYPVFALGGAIIDRAYLRNTVTVEMEQFKQRHFGHADVVLHMVDIHKRRGEYKFLTDPVKRTAFFADLNHLLATWSYQVVVCDFRLPAYVARYANPADPYHFGLEILVERFLIDLGSQTDNGYICAERRNPSPDKALMQAWERLTTGGGTGYALSRTINQHIVGLELRSKHPSLVGLQLADLIVTPVGRHVAGKAPQPHQVQWSVVQGKLRQRCGSYHDSGLIIRP